MAEDFVGKMRARAQGGEETSEPPRRAAETFTRSPRKKEPVHRTTLNLPISVYEELRQEAFDQETTMTELLINAWRNRSSVD